MYIRGRQPFSVSPPNTTLHPTGGGASPNCWQLRHQRSHQESAGERAGRRNTCPSRGGLRALGQSSRHAANIEPACVTLDQRDDGEPTKAARELIGKSPKHLGLLSIIPQRIQNERLTAEATTRHLQQGKEPTDGEEKEGYGGRQKSAQS